MHTISLSQAFHNSGLQLPLRLRWESFADMPCGMSGPHSVIVEEKLYVGGGETGLYSDLYDDKRSVYEYQQREDKWAKLEQYQWRRFAMTALNRKLTLVGGVITSTLPLQVTNHIAVLEKNQWTNPYPHMPTRRYSPAVVSYNQWMVVAGGCDECHEDLATVELLNTENRQWVSLMPLPVKCGHLTSAIISSKIFLIGGSPRTTLTMSFHDIIQSSAKSSTTNKSAQWFTLPPPPLELSTAIALHGSLFTIGGCHDNHYSESIHIYLPDIRKWTKIGELPSARASCSCILLSTGHLVVAGGLDGNGKRTSRVNVAVLNE